MNYFKIFERVCYARISKPKGIQFQK